MQSGATGLLKTCENIRTSLNSKEHTVAITIDLSKAFDSINYNLHFAKLAAHGVDDDALHLLRSNLAEPKQDVKINDS